MASPVQAGGTPASPTAHIVSEHDNTRKGNPLVRLTGFAKGVTFPDAAGTDLADKAALTGLVQTTMKPQNLPGTIPALLAQISRLTDENPEFARQNAIFRQI
jgi:hypothetical protein